MIDEKLIADCQRNDRSAQRRLYDLMLPYLAAVSRRYLSNLSDVDDALQESFIAIFKSIQKYEPTRASFRTWAVRITIHATLKVNERMNKMSTVEYISHTHEGSTPPSVEAKMSDDDMLAFLKGMPTDLYTAFNMHVVDGYSHKEIGEILKIDPALSRQRLSRARKWISDRTEGVQAAEHGQKKRM